MVRIACKSRIYLWPKLGGRFSDVGKKIMTSELSELMPKEIRLPEHGRYNMPRVRTEAIEKIFQEDYRNILGKGKPVPVATVSEIIPGQYPLK